MRAKTDRHRRLTGCRQPRPRWRPVRHRPAPWPAGSQESRHGRLRAGGPLAAAAARHRPLARRMDVGIGRRRVGGKPGQGLGDAARRNLAAARRRAVDLRLPAEPAPHQHRPARLLRQRRTLSRCGGTTWCSPSTATASTIEEWLQHDKYLAPPRGTGLGEMGRGPHKILMNPVRPGEAHLDRRRRHARDQHLHATTASCVKTMGERGVPGRGPNNFNRPTDIAWLPDGTFFVADGYAGTRVAKFDRERKVPDGLGTAAGRSRQSRSRTSSGRCTASASAATAGSSSPIASTTGCRCSTRTASS